MALAVGVLVGGVLQLAVQVPALVRVGFLPRLRWRRADLAAAWHHAGVRHVLRQMGPALLGVSVAQISLVINTQIASHIAVGAVSWLGYADRLMEFPTALLGVALGVVLLPQLAGARARGDAAATAALLDWGLRLTLLLALPCALALVVFPRPMVATLFNYGAFGGADVEQTVRALRGYGAGLLGLIGVKVLAPGFYASQDIRTPVKIAVGVLVATQLMNLVFVPWLGHAGLALSIGLGALVNAAALLVGLLRRGIYRPLPGWRGFGLRVVAVNLVVGAVLAAGSVSLDWVAMRAHWAVRAGWLALALGGVALLYLGLLVGAGVGLRQFVRRG